MDTNYKKGLIQNFERGSAVTKRPKKFFALLLIGPTLTLHILTGAEKEKLRELSRH